MHTSGKMQEKRDADRSKRKCVELEESLRQQKEIAAQMRRATGNASEQATDEAIVRPLLDLDQRGDGHGLELRIGQPGGGEHRIEAAPSLPLLPGYGKAFQMLEERSVTGASRITATLPARKKSKVRIQIKRQSSL